MSADFAPLAPSVIAAVNDSDEAVCAWTAKFSQVEAELPEHLTSQTR